ncbi:MULTISPECIES: Rieske 2Fe-2S domain-containing protein [unclassified Carboxylicivirga]|uniref:Rieske 2Fe-2S domain-containing protein n=1 Tax=Carboxylicivirga TaxID=1628153 RepID=UPI003D324CF3
MKRFTFAILISLMALSCGKDSEIIPNVHFSTTIDIVPQYAGKSLFVIMRGSNGRVPGVNGVIVWSASSDQYYAFDRTCTYQHEDGRLHYVEIIEEGNPIVKCPQCGSEFLVATQYGDIIKGPAVYALKSYYTSYSNGQLTIRN